MNSIILSEGEIGKRIFQVRGHRVLLDSDLAELYEVETKTFNQAIKRNLARFPADFMFRLTEDEWQILRSQFVTLRSGHGEHRKYLPNVFTEQGVAMLSGVLNSPRAILANIAIIRAFVKLRQLLETNTELSRRLDDLESKYDRQFKSIFDAIRQLMTPAVEPRKRITGLGR